jgi:hypothetical protein
LSERLLDHREARALRDGFWLAVVRWMGAGGVAALVSLATVVLSFTVGGALSDDPVQAMQYAFAMMAVGTIGLVASLGVPIFAILSRWLTQRADLDEAARVLAEPVTADPAWARLDAQIRACLGRTDDPDLRAKLQQLHAMLEHEFRSAAALEPGSEADHRFRDVVGQAQRAVTRLQDSLSTSSADARDLVAFLEARAEVEAPLRRETSLSSDREKS